MPDPLYDALRAASDRLDALLTEVGCGVRNARRYDELESEACAIAGEVRGAFRGRRRQ